MRACEQRCKPAQHASRQGARASVTPPPNLKLVSKGVLDLSPPIPSLPYPPTQALRTMSQRYALASGLKLLKGHTALLTGASRGIGNEMAHRLTEEGVDKLILVAHPWHKADLEQAGALHAGHACAGPGWLRVWAGEGVQGPGRALRRSGWAQRSWGGRQGGSSACPSSLHQTAASAASFGSQGTPATLLWLRRSAAAPPPPCCAPAAPLRAPPPPRCVPAGMQVSKEVAECKTCGGTTVEQHVVDFANPQVGRGVGDRGQPVGLQNAARSKAIHGSGFKDHDSRRLSCHKA